MFNCSLFKFSTPKPGTKWERQLRFEHWNRSEPWILACSRWQGFVNLWFISSSNPEADQEWLWSTYFFIVCMIYHCSKNQNYWLRLCSRLQCGIDFDNHRNKRNSTHGPSHRIRNYKCREKFCPLQRIIFSKFWILPLQSGLLMALILQKLRVC